MHLTCGLWLRICLWRISGEERDSFTVMGFSQDAVLKGRSDGGGERKEFGSERKTGQVKKEWNSPRKGGGAGTGSARGGFGGKGFDSGGMREKKDKSWDSNGGRGGGVWHAKGEGKEVVRGKSAVGGGGQGMSEEKGGWEESAGREGRTAVVGDGKVMTLAQLAQVMGCDPLETEDLKLANKKLGTLPDLYPCKQLKKVDIGGNELATLEGLSGLRELVWLSIKDNRVEELDPLLRHVNMQILNIGVNRESRPPFSSNKVFYSQREFLRQTRWA